MTTDLNTLAKYFSDEDAARTLLGSWRWPNGVACPHCGGSAPYKLTPRKAGSKTRKGLYKCRACRKQFTVTVGTVFEDSRIPLSKWLLALHLMASSKKGISAHQLHGNLGLSYKAAWFMAHRLRYAMDDGPLAELLSGVVEVDETYFGGKRKRGTKRGRPGPDSHKAPVVALVQRGGKVKAFPVERVTTANLKAAIDANVAESARLVTDELPAYNRAVSDREHDRINHASGEYVRGDVGQSAASAVR